MRFQRSLVLSAVMAGVLVLPSAAAPQEDPFATFTHSENLQPRGASLRQATAFNSDLAFWGDRAYQGTYDGFRIIDVSDPDNPTSLNDYGQCTGSQGDVIVWEDMLVRSWDTSLVQISTAASCGGLPMPSFGGLHIFDVADPTDPALLGFVRLPCGSHTATGVPDPANGRLLVYNSGSSGACPWNEIVEIPLDSPDSARLVGLAPTGRSCHDTAVILGEAMLAACAGGNGFTVFSIGGERGGSLTEPEQLYSVSIPDVSIGHAVSFSWDGEVLVFGHEPGGGSQARCQESTPDHQKSVFFFEAATGDELGRWTVPRPQTVAENCTIHNFNVVPSADHRILVSGNYQSGISVVDFTDPANAAEIAFADPAPLSPVQLGGDWSSYWYNGLIYEGDITRGLLVWELLEEELVAGAITLEHLNPQTQETTIP